MAPLFVACGYRRDTPDITPLGVDASGSRVTGVTLSRFEQHRFGKQPVLKPDRAL
jgi:hypothetical protein